MQGFDKRAGLPAQETCLHILEVIDELVDEKLLIIISSHMNLLGTPCCGSTGDIWSTRSCRDSFACLRGSFTLDGDLLATILKDDQHKSTIVDMSPILDFRRFAEKHHTGAVLAAWKKAALEKFMLGHAVGLATEDGASNNKKANVILRQEMMVCYDHDIARAVLHASGETGTPGKSKNPELRSLTSKASKQSAAFSRSVVANLDCQEAQLQANPDLKLHQVLTTKTKNTTRWLGLREMCNRNRRIGPEICIALTGDTRGECGELAAGISSSSGSDSDSDDSDGGKQEKANHKSALKFPLAHRCLAPEESRKLEYFESLLDRAREVTLLIQDEKKGWGEGLDIGVSHMSIEAMRDEAVADVVEVLSGRGATESWKEVNAASLPNMFKTFRKVFAQELTNRFKLDTTPSDHILLAIVLNPAVNTDPDGPVLEGKAAKAAMMTGLYKRALRRQAIRMQEAPTPMDAAPAPAIAPAPALVDTPMNASPAPAPAPEPDPEPPKKRRSLGGMLAEKQRQEVMDPGEEVSIIDFKVAAEIEKFTLIRARILADGLKSEYYQGTTRFNLRKFWAIHKTMLPFHYRTYLAEVACKKAASANVESVFSGAGKFTAEAPLVGPLTLMRMIKLHYNWKYIFLRPTLQEIINRYKQKFHKCAADAPAAAAPAVAAAART